MPVNDGTSGYGGVIFGTGGVTFVNGGGTPYVQVGDDVATITIGTNGGGTAVPIPRSSFDHVSLTGTSGNDTLTGGTGDDTLDGDSGDDVLNGGGGNDTLIGWYGSDTLNGGAGDDYLVGGTELRYTGGGSDGPDYAVYSGNYASYDIHRQPTAQYASLEATVSGGADGHDTLGGIEYLVFADKTIKVADIPLDHVSLTGTAGNDTLNGGEGDDTLIGLGGDDTISGGGGSDSLSGSDGNDYIQASGSLTFIDAGAGDDTVVIGGNDAMTIDVATFSGGAGIDTLQNMGTITVKGAVFSAAASGFEILHCGNSYSADFVGDAGDNTLDFSGFTLAPGSWPLWADGGAGNDVLTGTASDDTLAGGDGNDMVYGGAGNDVLYGGSSQSYGSGKDSLFGGAGNDTLYLNGDFNNNGAISAGTALSGGDGDDTLIVGAYTTTAADALQGGNGTDTLTLRWSTVFTGTAVFSAAASGIEKLTLDNEYFSTASFPTVSGDASANTFDFSGFTLTWPGQGVIVNGLGGNDALTGTTQNDLLQGGDGNDTLAGSAGNDTIDGGTGTNVAVFSGNFSAYTFDKDSTGQSWIVKGPEGTDLVTNVQSYQFADRTMAASQLAPTPVTLSGTAGNDTLTGSWADDSLSGLGGDDVLYGAVGITYYSSGQATPAQGNDTLDGGDGNDRLYGRLGNDKLIGGNGNDTLAGGGGVDIYDGGAGDDLFLLGNDQSSAVVTATASLITGGDGVDTVRIVGPVQFTETSLTAASLSFEQFQFVDSSVNYAAGIVTPDTDSNYDFTGVAVIPYNGIGSGVRVTGGKGNDTITGTAGADSLNGYVGNDVLFGGLGNDSLWDANGYNTLHGGDGNDTLYGSGALYGEAGDDKIDGIIDNYKSGSLKIYGGDGNDTITGQSTAALPETIDAGAGDDVVSPGMMAVIGDGALQGGDGDDLLNLTSVQINASSFVAGAIGFERINCQGSIAIGNTNTTLDFSGATLVADDGRTAATQGIQVYCGTGTQAVTTSSLADTVIDYFGTLSVASLGDGDDTVTIGSSSASVIVMTAGLQGGAGTDLLHIAGPAGLYGATFSVASSGFERLQSDMSIANLTVATPTTLAGIVCDDNANSFDFSGFIITGGNGILVAGQGGNDTITGTYLADILYGGAGNDSLNGGGGSDYAVYMNARSSYTVTTNADGTTTVAGPAGEGTDTLRNIETIVFSDQLMTIADTSAPLLVSTSPSNNATGVAATANITLAFDENLAPGTGSFVIHNAADGSVVATVAANDYNQVSYVGSTVVINPTANLASNTSYYVTVDATALKDRSGNAYAGISSTTALRFTTSPGLYGSSGADTLTGSAANDTIQGLAGNDVLSGGGGTDALDGGAGTDTVLLTGKPADYFAATNSDGSLTVIGKGETDTFIAIEQVSFQGVGTLSLAQFQAQAMSAATMLGYIASYKDLMAAFGADPVLGAKHYFNNGLPEGRTVSFNALNYIASYSDLIGAFGDNQTAATEHYIKNGFGEGRKVTFDPLAYLASYGDLMGAFGDNQTLAAEHYIKNGYAEGRKASFNALNYIASYSDLIGAFGDNVTAAEEHYIQNGFGEGRTVSFDPLAYLCSYGDLMGAFGDNQTFAVEHYIKNGYGEGRGVSFNALNYIASYGDLIGAFGDNVTAAEEHYIKNGYGEGRKVTFDPVAYLINNTDLGSCGFTASNVTEHYIKNGYSEHRTANGSFGSEQANHALTIGGSVSDTLATSGDQDWFGVTLTAGQSYTFTLSGADGSNGTLADPFLGLYDAHGLLVTSNNDATGHDSKITFTATASGAFYLVASANDTGTGTYKLFGATGG